MFMSPTDISREVGPPGYGPGENQGNIASWISTCNKQRMFTGPSTISSEVALPGYSPVGIQGTDGSRSMNLEAFPPGYGPGENQCGGASESVISPQVQSVESVEFSDEARKKAIQRELRRRQKFR
jgi:remodeling and spacing factor 1